MKLALSKVELFVGALLLAIGFLIHIGGLVCVVVDASCGMVEPVLAFFGILLGSSVLVAGLACRASSRAAILGHVPLACSAFFLLTLT